MNVYQYIPREDAQSQWKTIGVWVNSRLVAQEFVPAGDRDDIDAATPPLMASNFALSGNF